MLPVMNEARRPIEPLESTLLSPAFSARDGLGSPTVLRTSCGPRPRWALRLVCVVATVALGWGDSAGAQVSERTSPTEQEVTEGELFEVVLPIPAKKADFMSPRPGVDYVWVPGHWDRSEGEWRWQVGRWLVPPFASAYWVRGPLESRRARVAVDERLLGRRRLDSDGRCADRGSQRLLPKRSRRSRRRSRCGSQAAGSGRVSGAGALAIGRRSRLPRQSGSRVVGNGSAPTSGAG